jgi:hypothetical protein
VPPPTAHAKAACAAALAAVFLGGCGATHATPVLSSAAAARMRADLARLRSSASAHNPAGARAELDAFAAEVAGQSSAGHLTSATHTALETAIARTRARIDAEVTAPVPVPVPVPVTTPQVVAQPVAPTRPSPPAGGKGKDKPGKGGGGGGKGKGPGKH